MSNNGKTTAFKKGMLIYIGVLVLLIVASQIVLWEFLSSYQQSLPETVANRFAKNANEDYWKSFLTENIHGSPFSAKEADVQIAYDAYIKGKELKVRRSALESKDGYQVFKISGNDLELCSITLKQTADGSFGMARWETEKEEASEALLDAVNPLLTLFIPKDGSFTVNGASAEVKGEVTESPYLTAFESKEEKGFTKYTFRAPCEKQDIAVKSGDEVLKLSENKDGTYIFDLPGERIDQSITVPEGAEVYVNELRLTTEYISQKGADYPFINPLEKELADAPKATVYTVKGLYQKPDVRVVYNGEELVGSDNGENGIAYAFNEKGTDYRLQVPENAVVKVNGIDISGNDDYITAKDIEYMAVSEYGAELVNPLKCAVYAFKGMMFVPEIEVANAENGEEYQVTKLTASDYVCNFAPDAALLTEYGELAQNFTIAMMEYMFFGREKMAETFPKALSLTRKNSKAYTSIYDSYSGIYWRREHVITYNDMYVDGFIKYADNAFQCDVHYDVTGNAVTVDRVDYAKGVYRLLFVKGNNGWEVVEFTLIDE